jgi:Protein of unknown function (DUF4242)
MTDENDENSDLAGVLVVWLGAIYIPEKNDEEVILKKYMIELDLPTVAILEQEQLTETADGPNEPLQLLAPGIQWIESYVADDKTFSVYLAENEVLIRLHAKLTGFPVSKITEIGKMIDPTTAGGLEL